MTIDAPIPSKYNPDLVGQVILNEIIEQHPVRRTIGELSLRIVADPDDVREVETAIEAVRDLRRSGLVRYRDDDLLVEPTQPALRAFELLSPDSRLARGGSREG